MVISTLSSSPQGHVVAFALPFWGHVKPLCALLSKVVRLRRVYATFFTDISFLPKVLDEISRQFVTEQEQDLRNLIRVVALPSPPALFQFEPYEAAFAEGYRSLYEERSIAKSPDGNLIYEAIARPQLVILDFFCYSSMKEIRNISGMTIPLYAWQTGALSAVLFIFGPENMGGNGDLAEKISKVDIEDPDLREKEIYRIYRRMNNQLVEIAGIPTMHDYEFVPQISMLPVNPLAVVYMCQYAYRFFSECEGAINSSSRLYEGDTIDKVQEWFDGRPIITVGPLSLQESTTDVVKEKLIAPDERKVEQFLQDALMKHGSRSVIYISFGTVWWPAEPDKIWTVIDVLIKLNIPFLFSHASPIAIIPEEIINKVNGSGLGYMAPWLPQQMILHHKACGWFITHCGHNSVMESLTAGIPLICWPYDVDQPLNAANITDVHHVGYELFEVRNGHGLRPIHRLGNKVPEGTIEAVRREATDAFTKARGEDGEKKRSKAQWFSKKFAEGWESGGSSWEELRKVVNILS